MSGHYGFIETGRLIEIETVRRGRRANEFSTSPALSLSNEAVGVDDSNVVFRPADDIQDTQDRLNALDSYVPFAQKAYAERGLVYPFARTGSALTVLPGKRSRDLARSAVELAELSGIGGKSAKSFEVRATKALHRFIGGDGIVVGAPRADGTGPKRAVDKFRKALTFEMGNFRRAAYPPNGDFGVDAFVILGHHWGGPVVFVQVKNGPFDPDKFGSELLTGSDACNDWFGRRLDKVRKVVPVCAVNTILTHGAKETAYLACLNGSGYHVIDCVDILCAESAATVVKRVKNRLQIM